MALLHASQFFQGNVTSINPTRTNLYTIAAGHRIILRSIAVRNLNGAASQTFYVYINAIPIHSELLTSGGSTGGSSEWRPWLVYGPGDIIGMAASTATGFGVLVSGSVYTI